MELGIAVIFLIGLPIAYLFQVGKPRGFALSVLFVVFAAATALWAISRSRSDWASMGYYLVPGDAALAGILSLTFSRKKDHAVPDLRILAWLALAGSILIVVFNLVSGFQSISENRAADEYDEVTFRQYDREKASIGSYLQKNRGRETAWLDSSIRTRMQDSLFLSVALESGFVSPDLLDTLARSPFQRVALSAIGNPKARGETLVRAYRAHADSNIFVEVSGPQSQYTRGSNPRDLPASEQFDGH